MDTDFTGLVDGWEVNGNPIQITGWTSPTVAEFDVGGSGVHNIGDPYTFAESVEVLTPDGGGVYAASGNVEEA